MSFKVLVVGDVFGRPGRRVLSQVLEEIILAEDIDFTVVNGENAAGGKGITPEIAQEFYKWGVDVITTGNHARDKKLIDSLLISSQRILRPANYPDKIPGVGYCLRPGKSGKTYAVINLMGLVHMQDLRSPFELAEEILEKLQSETNLILVDFHAEATSEKRAMGWYLDGKVSAVFGTHTHVQTADEEVLPKGTAYISDLGMTGPYNSVIGMKVEKSLNRFLNGERGGFEVAKGNVKFCGAIIELNESGTAEGIKRIQIPLREN